MGKAKRAHDLISSGLYVLVGPARDAFAHPTGALANGRSVDLVFSDIMMPGGMNGVDLAREIKRRRSDIPVLLTSGYFEAAVHDAEAAGIQILSKPYHIDELAAAINAAKSPTS